MLGGQVRVVVVENGYQTDATWNGQPIIYGGDPTKTAQAVAKAISDGADSLVIEASAKVQSAVVTAVQTQLQQQQLPMVLTPQALTPGFASNLGPVGDLRGVLMTVGQNTDDAAALGTGPNSEAISAFLQAVRMAADAPGVNDVYGDGDFAAAASFADPASHDATVAKVRAAEKAASDKTSVAVALASLKLGATDGLVGGSLDFSTPQALSSSNILTLFASSQTTGLRPIPSPGTDLPSLIWVAMQGQ